MDVAEGKVLDAVIRIHRLEGDGLGDVAAKPAAKGSGVNRLLGMDDVFLAFVQRAHRHLDFVDAFVGLRGAVIGVVILLAPDFDPAGRVGVGGEDDLIVVLHRIDDGAAGDPVEGEVGQKGDGEERGEAQGPVFEEGIVLKEGLRIDEEEEIEEDEDRRRGDGDEELRPDEAHVIEAAQGDDHDDGG